MTRGLTKVKEEQGKEEPEPKLVALQQSQRAHFNTHASQARRTPAQLSAVAERQFRWAIYYESSGRRFLFARLAVGLAFNKSVCCGGAIRKVLLKRSHSKSFTTTF